MNRGGAGIARSVEANPILLTWTKKEEHAGCSAPAATATGSSGGFDVPTAATEMMMH